MKMDPRWKPTKYTLHRGILSASRDPREVAIGSRLIANLTARFYQTAIAQHARGRLLDLGCGKAPLYGAYAPHVEEVMRVDWGEGLHGQNYLDLVHDLNAPLPFDNDRFDTIILSDVLEHLASPKNFWKELERVLAPDGKIILNVPFFYRLHEEPYDFYRYTKHALIRFASNCGLQIDMLQPLGGVPEIMVDMTAKLLSYSRLSRWIAISIQDIWLLLLGTKPARALSAKTAHTFPLSYAMIARKPSRPQAHEQV